MFIYTQWARIMFGLPFSFDNIKCLHVWEKKREWMSTSGQMAMNVLKKSALIIRSSITRKGLNLRCKSMATIKQASNHPSPEKCFTPSFFLWLPNFNSNEKKKCQVKKIFRIFIYSSILSRYSSSILFIIIFMLLS